MFFWNKWKEHQAEKKKKTTDEKIDALEKELETHEKKKIKDEELLKNLNDVDSNL